MYIHAFIYSFIDQNLGLYKIILEYTNTKPSLIFIFGIQSAYLHIRQIKDNLIRRCYFVKKKLLQVPNFWINNSKMTNLKASDWNDD